MEPYLDNLNGEECEDPHCHGCQKPIEDGSVVQFGDGIWHFECFRCAKCHKLVECYSNLLLLRDGSPICEDCSYSCHACSKTIKDEAIMTGDEAYHAECFRCIQCNKKIDDLVFTQTSKGIYCTKCHEARKLQRMKRRDERNNNRQNTRPNPTFRASSTTSIVNAYTDDTTTRASLLDSDDISELNDMLQRNSEDSPLSDSTKYEIDQLSEADQIRNLKRELSETKSKLKEVEGKFNKIKTISRKALDEFHLVKEGYATEIQARKEADLTVIRLKSEINFYQQASIFSGPEFIHYSKEDIEDLNQTRADLEQTCFELRSERDVLITELSKISKDIDKTLLSQKTHDLHWERLQHAYQQQLDSMQKDIQSAKASYSKLIKGREDIISDMILLNTKNAELTQLNNDLSRKVMEREQEAKALFAGTNFLSSPESAVDQQPDHKRNPSSGSLTEAKLAQRDSFNGSAAPKMFKFRRNRSNSVKRKEEKLISVPYEKTHELESEPRGKHHFVQTKFIMPVKCEGCGEKMRRVNELKCSECGIVCHSKCIYAVPQVCNRKTSLDSNKSEPLMFGNDLIKQVQAEKGKIPILVEKCVECVESRGLDYEGIYRKSGGVGQMRQIQQAFEKGEIPNLIDEEKWNDICAVTSVLKQYFRELPNPLFTYELHSKFIEAIMSGKSEDQLKSISQLIQILPIENFNTLKYIMEHLDRVQQKSKENLMTSKNLAVIFGPTLLRHQDENRDLLEMNHKINIIEFILNHMDTLFVIETIMGSATSTISSTQEFRRPPRGNNRTEDTTTPAVPPRQNANYI